MAKLDLATVIDIRVVRSDREVNPRPCFFAAAIVFLGRDGESRSH